MSRLFTSLFLIFSLGAPAAYAAGSGGGGGGASIPSGGGSAGSKSAEQVANSAYKSGLKYKKRALRYEEKAAGANDDAKRDKYLAKARAQYEKSVDKYREAFRANRQFHEALNELGYAYRKTGRFDDALRAYDRAIELQPEFAEAIEYRGEAYLALDQFDRTREAYMSLFRLDQDQAALLMTAMEAWLVERDVAAGPEADAFAAWIEERRTLAEGTQTLSLNNQRDW